MKNPDENSFEHEVNFQKLHNVLEFIVYLKGDVNIILTTKA